jgi:hypothetical protein
MVWPNTQPVIASVQDKQPALDRSTCELPGHAVGCSNLAKDAETAIAAAAATDRPVPYPASPKVRLVARYRAFFVHKIPERFARVFRGHGLKCEWRRAYVKRVF